MPGMDGLTLCRELKALRSETVAIILTAYAAAATEDNALAAGEWRLLSKPVDLTNLFRLVDEATGWPLVLLVDDDRDLCRRRSRTSSASAAFETATAHDGEEAAVRLREARYRVVLIDMRLPKGSGDEVFRLVRRVDPTAHTVVITGYRTRQTPRSRTSFAKESTPSGTSRSICPTCSWPSALTDKGAGT